MILESASAVAQEPREIAARAPLQKAGGDDRVDAVRPNALAHGLERHVGRGAESELAPHPAQLLSRRPAQPTRGLGNRPADRVAAAEGVRKRERYCGSARVDRPAGAPPRGGQGAPRGSAAGGWRPRAAAGARATSHGPAAASARPGSGPATTQPSAKAQA